MKAIIVEGKIKHFVEIPTKWKQDGQNFYNYDKSDPSLHYEHGWRDIVIPEYDKDTQKLKDIYFDDVNDNFTYNTEGLSPEEIDSRKTGNEVEDLYSLIETLESFEKVVLRQAGFMEVLRERSLYEAYIILNNLSPSGNLKNVKDQMMPILQGYETEVK